MDSALLHRLVLLRPAAEMICRVLVGVSTTIYSVVTYTYESQEKSHTQGRQHRRQEHFDLSVVRLLSYSYVQREEKLQR